MNNETRIRSIFYGLCKIHNKRVWGIINKFLRVKYMHTVLRPDFLKTEVTRFEHGIKDGENTFDIGDINAMYFAIRQFEVVYGEIVNALAQEAINTAVTLGGTELDMSEKYNVLVYVAVFIRTAMELGYAPEIMKPDAE